ncbi:DNA polymerase III subunit gamma and tau [Nocardia yamanashiensis]|uniref:DNA polymerase III subunit gamma and tau n=1 Tax=Nocardia yamanashiensis TaxID=209247 RepID=UPI001E4F4F8E|nr:DNA polymerase III subunit gamma and tau [Nocardia yamanashiensis]UGT40265.1 DNA polymerase III subunit gamma and tau [Nocardia yamanashiensis]
MALYRKYRPATFAEVVGQEHVTDPLSTALDTGRISHAYLFSGPRGCGKTSSARILARSLNCVQGPTSKPCGVCASCVALGPGGPGNLDVIELDAASHGGVDDTRELRDKAFYAPAESRYRVFIVDEAHMVTTAGFNALLKIVEEPPAHLIFVFATTEPDKVLPTIRSRTHHYPFRLLPPATMRGLLGKICDQENVQVEESVYPLVIRAGGGSPRDSLSVLDQLLAGAGPEGVTYPRAVSLLGVTDIALIDNAVDALANSDGAALFGTIDSVVEAGHDPRRFATDLLERLRDLILLRAVPDATERNLVTGPGDVLDRMRAQANNIGPATLARHAELLHEGLGDMRGATNPRLLLEVIAARMLLPAASDTESAALQRLESLERRIANGLPAAPAGAPQPQSAPSAGPASNQAVQGNSVPAAPIAPPAGGNRRRGAEALAALRAEKGGDPTPPGAQAGTAAATSSTPPQAAEVTRPTSAPDSAPAQQAPAVQQPTAHGVSGEPESTPTPVQQAAEPEAAAQPAATAVRPPELSPVSAAAVQVAATTGGQSDSDAGAPAPANVVAAQGQPAHPAERATAMPSEAVGAAPVTPYEPDAGEPAVTAHSAAMESPAVDAVDTSQPAGDAVVEAPSGAVAAEAEALSAVARETDRAAEQAAPQRISESLPDPADAAGPDVAAGIAPDVAVPGAEAPSLPEIAPAAEAVGAQPDSTAGSSGVAWGAPVGAAPGAVGADAESGAAEAAEPAVAAGGALAHASDDVLQEIEAAWSDIRAKVREFGAAVQALLSGASVARVEGMTIVFAHQHAPLAQRLSQPKNLEAVRSAVKAVLGRDHDVKWEVGGSGSAPSARGGASGSGGRGPATKEAEKKAAPKFSRPSQAKGAAPAAPAAEAPAGWGSAPEVKAAPAAPVQAPVERGSGGSGAGAPAPQVTPYDDDIPLPDGPDLPDDPGAVDYPPVGYDGVPPATTEEEEREMLEESAKPVPAGERRDPDDVALELLRAELGATPLEG